MKKLVFRQAYILPAGVLVLKGCSPIVDAVPSSLPSNYMA